MGFYIIFFIFIIILAFLLYIDIKFFNEESAIRMGFFVILSLLIAYIIAEIIVYFFPTFLDNPYLDKF